MVTLGGPGTAVGGGLSLLGPGALSRVSHMRGSVLRAGHVPGAEDSGVREIVLGPAELTQPRERESVEGSGKSYSCEVREAWVSVSPLALPSCVIVHK